MIQSTHGRTKTTIESELNMYVEQAAVSIEHTAVVEVTEDFRVYLRRILAQGCEGYFARRQEMATDEVKGTEEYREEMSMFEDVGYQESTKPWLY